MPADCHVELRRAGTASGARPSIGDYALIGDCRSAALVSRDGSIDWLCWPRFDSPSVLAGLLDAGRGGRFAVRPATAFTSARRYVGETAVLETTYETATGVARVTDLMPVTSEADKRARLWPAHALLRRLEGVAGEVTLAVTCDPRPDYARTAPAPRQRGALGFAYEHRGGVLWICGDVPLRTAEAGSALEGRVTLRPAERRYLWLVAAEREPAVLPAHGDHAERALRASLAWWEGWVARCRYDGPYRAAVVRSALTLKLLTYAPSGAVVAAPTTSLPERLGGTRNWDYRYCWLRDASLTLQALYDLGYQAEAEAFLSWLLYATRLTQPELRVLYDVYGETRLHERELAHLRGFCDSRPVRIGNDASRQLQLDVYGELLDAVYEFVRRGGRLDRPTARLLTGLGRTVCRRWREPDESIWEERGGRRQHTYSKIMCWVALDRLLRLHAERHLRVAEAVLVRERAAIRDAIERDGFDSALDSYVSVFGGRDVDASLLLAARYGYAEPTAPRMRATSRRIEERLGVGGGLLYRYHSERDGLPAGEGAFGICSFWAADCRARQGDVDGAAAAFERILSFANDVGLFAEEIDPGSGAALGNFPQAFTHVGLIDVALTLQARTAGGSGPGDGR